MTDRRLDIITELLRHYNTVENPTYAPSGVPGNDRCRTYHPNTSSLTSQETA